MWLIINSIHRNSIDITTYLLYYKYRITREEIRKMIRTFKEVPSFTAKWQSLGLTDEDLRELENILLKNPKTGDAIQGTGGIRKIRIPVDNMGKRSGGRVIYVDIEIKECIYLLNVYAKNEQTDLSEKEKKLLKKLVEALKEE